MRWCGGVSADDVKDLLGARVSIPRDSRAPAEHDLLPPSQHEIP